MSDHRRGPRRDRRGAQAEVEELAERTGALLATTLPARGIFDHNPFSIGIAGGYAHEIAREIGAQADLVVGGELRYSPSGYYCFGVNAAVQPNDLKYRRTIHNFDLPNSCRDRRRCAGSSQQPRSA